MDFKLSSSEIDKTFKPGNLWREMLNYTNSHDKSSLISKYISEEMIKKEIRGLIQDMKVKKTIFKSFNLFKAYLFEKILVPLHSKSQNPRSFESRKLKLLMKILSTQEFYIQEKEDFIKTIFEKKSSSNEDLAFVKAEKTCRVHCKFQTNLIFLLCALSRVICKLTCAEKSFMISAKSPSCRTPKFCLINNLPTMRGTSQTHQQITTKCTSTERRNPQVQNLKFNSFNQDSDFLANPKKQDEDDEDGEQDGGDEDCQQNENILTQDLRSRRSSTIYKNKRRIGLCSPKGPASPLSPQCLQVNAFQFGDALSKLYSRTNRVTSKPKKRSRIRHQRNEDVLSMPSQPRSPINSFISENRNKADNRACKPSVIRKILKKKPLNETKRVIRLNKSQRRKFTIFKKQVRTPLTKLKKLQKVKREILSPIRCTSPFLFSNRGSPNAICHPNHHNL
ncbi:unnamed protein product [Moneuplotes crassus]|uniref:Uncharacterized protein n=1 Tax=Euplotes crassus TaxID=5936 RepID=A0AAD2DAX8_EUPCR|nr:unnamed protein product [Moneuplotes crassus]